MISLEQDLEDLPVEQPEVLVLTDPQHLLIHLVGPVPVRRLEGVGCVLPVAGLLVGPVPHLDHVAPAENRPEQAVPLNRVVLLPLFQQVLLLVGYGEHQGFQGVVRDEFLELGLPPGHGREPTIDFILVVSDYD